MALLCFLPIFYQSARVSRTVIMSHIPGIMSSFFFVRAIKGLVPLVSRLNEALKVEIKTMLMLVEIYCIRRMFCCFPARVPLQATYNNRGAGVERKGG